nr:hypothetical protein [Tanacetum cinerariifolium]
MATLADKAILSGADNCPPMLKKDMYDSWKSIMELYMLNIQHGIMILESVENAIQADCDVKATNIILQGLPPEVYALVSNHKVIKELWERIQLLMQGTSLTKQARECKLSDEFDKFAYKKEESLRDFYLIFSLLLNDMNIYNMNLEQFQMNTKFLNTLPPEWSKFVTNVKLVRDLYTKNVDQLHAYLGQYEYHANEVRIMHERTSDPLALVGNHQMTKSPYQTHQQSYQHTQFQPQVSSFHSSQYGSPYHSSQYASQAQSSTPLSITYPSNDFQSSVYHNVYNPSSSIPQVEYAPLVHQQSDFSQPDTGLVFLVFQKGDDLIDDINHMMSFLTAFVTSRYPPTNNQLRNSFSPRQQATINNGRVTVQPIQGRQNSLAAADDLDAYNSDCDEINSAKIDLMANLSYYGFDNLTEDNKNVNELLTVKLERYKDQVRILKERNNVDKASDSCARSLEIDNLKNTLLEHLKERESLEQMTELSAEQVFWSQNSGNFEEPNLSSRTTIVEVPKKLPKVNMDLFNSFEQFLIDELTEVQNVFNQIEHAVEQHCVEKNKFQDKMKDVLKENERLLEQAISTYIVNIVVTTNVNYACKTVNECERCVTIETELQRDYIKRECYDKLFKQYTTLEKHCISLVVDTQLEQEIFQRNNSFSQQSAPTFDQLFEINDLKAQFQEKDTIIMKLKERIKSLSGNLKEEKIKRELEEIEPINIELDHTVTKLVTENEHFKQTYKQLYDSIKSSRVNLLTNASGSQPLGNTKKDRIQQTQSRAKKNKLEDHPRNVRPSLHNSKSVVNTKAISSVPNSKLNVNSDLKCAMCNGCLFSDNHDSCVLEFINSVNARVKSKFAKKPMNRKIWKPTGKVFTTIGHK